MPIKTTIITVRGVTPDEVRRLRNIQARSFPQHTRAGSYLEIMRAGLAALEGKC